MMVTVVREMATDSGKSLKCNNVAYQQCGHKQTKLITDQVDGHSSTCSHL